MDPGALLDKFIDLRGFTGLLVVVLLFGIVAMYRGYEKRLKEVSEANKVFIGSVMAAHSKERSEWREAAQITHSEASRMLQEEGKATREALSQVTTVVARLEGIISQINRKDR